VIVRRIFGSDTKNPLVQIFAVFLPIVVIVIGLIPAAMAQFAISLDVIFPATALIVLILWNILIAGLLLFLGRGVLTKSNG